MSTPPHAREERHPSALWVVIAAGLAFTLARQVAGHGDYLVDLRAFYCGGWSVLHHADPYTSAATACGNAIEPGAAILRAPHPPFALVFYALLALAPFKIVGYAYIVLAWLAVGATASYLSKLTGIEPWIIALGTAPLLGYFCISLGQPQPFVALALVLSAYFLTTNRPRAAAIFGSLTLVFPQFGIPVVAALFVCKPRTRATLGACVALLGLVGLAVLGPAANLHYVTVSLRLEQLQTAGDALQYGLPWLLQQFGVPPAPAALAGSIWYVTVLATGIALLRRRASSVADPFVVVLPAALVTLSSTFVHPQHFALALPFAICALSSSGRATVPAIIATALLAVPWMDCIVPTSAPHDVARALVFCALAVTFAGSLLRSRTTLGLGAVSLRLGALFAIFALCVMIIHVALRGIPSVDTPPDTLATLAFKLPSIIALVAVLFYRARAARPAALPTG